MSSSGGSGNSNWSSKAGKCPSEAETEKIKSDGKEAEAAIKSPEGVDQMVLAFEKTAAIYDTLGDYLPDEYHDDLSTLTEVYKALIDAYRSVDASDLDNLSKADQDKILEATAPIDDAKFDEAIDRIADYFAETCPEIASTSP